MPIGSGRTHEPSLRELTSQLDGLRELNESRFTSIRELLDERDRLYKERSDAQKTAVDAALAAQKEQTASSFSSSEKAIRKAEESQQSYNAGHNDLSRKMEAQYALMVPKTEAQLKWDSAERDTSEIHKELAIVRESTPKDINSLRFELMREISNLRESRSEGGGERSGARFAQEQTNRSTMILIALLGVGITMVGLIITILARFPAR